MSTQQAPFKTKNSAQEYHHRKSWVQIARPLTLTGTISPIIVGTIVASMYGPVHYDMFLILILATVFIQAAVNILNDYFDFANGQDQDRWHILDPGKETHTGPRHSILPVFAISMLGVSIILGLWLAMNSQLWIIFIGIAGIFAGYKYSSGGRHSLSALGFGEATAAVFLGVAPVMLAFIVQGQSFGWIAFIFSFLFAILISIMILTNNIRDIQKDKGFRNTIAMRMGKRRSVLLLTSLAGSAYVIVTGLVIAQVLPWTALLVYFAVPIAYRLRMAFRKDATRAEEMKGMKLAAQHHWVFSFLLIAGMFLGLFIL